MKFRKITFKDHPILGSVSFDFTDASGKTVDTIIIAGENGCGKSFLLSFLNTYNPSASAKKLGFVLRVEVELTEDDLRILNEDKVFLNVFAPQFSGNIVTFIHDTKFRDDNSRVEFNTKDGKTAIGNTFQFVKIRSYISLFFQMWRLIFHLGIFDIPLLLILMLMSLGRSVPLVISQRRLSNF